MRGLTTTNSYHGRTLATMSATGKAHWQQRFEPETPGFSMYNIFEPGDQGGIYSGQPLAMAVGKEVVHDRPIMS